LSFAVLTDVSVHPDLGGLPPNVVAGLVHLSNNAAGVLLLVSGLGIAISLIGWVIASFTNNQQLGERSRSGLWISISAIALLYVAVAAANYAGRLFS